MKIIAVDDEPRALNILLRAIEEALPEAEVRIYVRASDALQAVQNGFLPDIAFWDIEMPGLSGMDAAKSLKALAPEVNVIFVTGYSQYALDALRIHASGYLLKPVTADQIREEVKNLRRPVPEPSRKKLIVRTFPNFEVYAHGKPVKFSRSKSKEVFAYLVDRGATGATSAEIAAVLWDDGLYDRSRQKQLQVFLHDMLRALKAVDAEDIVIRSGTDIVLNIELLDCDAYRFLAGDPEMLHAYRGEYMSQYPWAEFTNGRLSSKAIE